MNLTKLHRQAFVSAVIADVPTVDYGEEVSKLIQGFAIKALPPKVLALYQDSELRHFVALQQIYVSETCTYCYYPGGERLIFTDEQNAEIKKLAQKCNEQAAEIRALTAKLRGAIAGCKTRKQAVQLLPEFEKYLPNEAAEATKGVPMITGWVTSLTSMGWPKGESKKQEVSVQNAVAEMVAETVVPA